MEVEKNIVSPPAGPWPPNYWIGKEGFLRKEKEDLRKEKADLRKEKIESLEILKLSWNTSQWNMPTTDIEEGVLAIYIPPFHVLITNFAQTYYLIDVVVRRTFNVTKLSDSFFDQKRKLYSLSNLDIAGFSENSSYQVQYFRTESRRMMDILESLKPGKSIWLSGCPGIGKSTTLFGWLNLAEVSKDGYLWMHYEDDLTVYVIYRRSNGESFSSKMAADQRVLKELVEKTSDIKYIAIDGVDSNSYLISNLFAWSAKREDVSAIACTSVAAFNYNQAKEKRLRWPEKIEVNSWSWGDYCEAFDANIPALRPRFTDLEAMKKAYYFAGGSMRLMMEDIRIIISSIDSKFAKVSDYGLLLKNLQGESAQHSVNSLMALFDSKPYPLSAYVLKSLGLKVDDAFLAEAAIAWIGNYPLQGFIFEQRIMRAIQRTLDEQFILRSWLVSNTSVVIEWPINAEMTAEYTNLNDLSEDNTERNNSWIHPRVFNQAATDLLYYHEKGQLDIFQFTIAKTHDYKFGGLKQILDRFCTDDGESIINYYVVVPKENTKFRVQPGNIYDADLLSTYDRGWTWTFNTQSDNDTDIESEGGEGTRSRRKPKDWAETTRIKVLYVGKETKYK